MSSTLIILSLFLSPDIGPILLTLLVAMIIVVAIIDVMIDKRSIAKNPDPAVYSDRNLIVGKGWSMRYSGDTKYINGIPVSTEDQLAEWSVLKGFSCSISSHLSDLMRSAETGSCENYATLQRDWDISYARLRDLCIRHKLWNTAIGDCQIFEPTPYQLRLERDLQNRFSEACELGIDLAYNRRNVRKEILDYLLTQPRHVVVRRKMVNELAGNNEAQKKLYRNECRAMVLDGILSETHDEKGRLVVRKKRKSHPRKKSGQVEPSAFRSELYASVDYRMWCKVKHTVGKPENVDVQNNCCEFHSLSSGELYHTSLTQCTCFAYKNGNSPCKHMVALARHLRYI